MKNKKLIIALAAFAAVIALLAGVYFGTRPAASEGAKTITVAVTHQDGTEKTFTCHTSEEYLGAVLLAEKLAEGEDSQYGLVIDTVDGETASWEENQSYWALFIGDEYAATGADTTPVTDGGLYKLVYTIG